MTTSSSGAGTPGPIPALPAAPAAAPVGAPAPTTPGVPATGALGTPPGAPAPAATPPTSASAPPSPMPASALPALTADDVRAWLALRGVATADMDDHAVRMDIVSLEGAMTDRQLGITLCWIRDKLVANGRPAFDPSGVTIVSLLAEVAAAAAAMAPPAPAGPKPPSRLWLAILWCIGTISWTLTKLRSAGGRAVTGIASGGRAVGRGIASAGRTVGRATVSGGGAIGRHWKPLLVVAASLAMLAMVIFGVIKGYEWWQSQPAEVAQKPSPAPVAVTPTPEPTPPVAVTPTPEPPPPVVVAPTPEPPPPVAVTPTPEPTPPVAVTPTPIQPVIPGPTGPAIYHPQLDLECLMYGRLQACNMPPGCTEGFITNPPRLQITCPGGIVYTDAKSMTEYPANQRVSVQLRPGL